MKFKKLYESLIKEVGTRKDLIHVNRSTKNIIKLSKEEVDESRENYGNLYQGDWSPWYEIKYTGKNNSLLKRIIRGAMKEGLSIGKMGNKHFVSYILGPDVPESSFNRMFFGIDKSDNPFEYVYVVKMGIGYIVDHDNYIIEINENKVWQRGKELKNSQEIIDKYRVMGEGIKEIGIEKSVDLINKLRDIK
jgi:hypothetical protein